MFYLAAASSITNSILENSSLRMCDRYLSAATYSPKLNMRVERQSGEIL
ncbi:hypothetical protein [Nostoc sp. WHI]|nr:hypothetical protein [Nostoc sp. WHI]